MTSAKINKTACVVLGQDTGFLARLQDSASAARAFHTSIPGGARATSQDATPEDCYSPPTAIIWMCLGFIFCCRAGLS